MESARASDIDPRYGSGLLDRTFFFRETEEGPLVSLPEIRAIKRRLIC